MADADDPTAGFARHVALCRNAVLPGERLPFLLGTHRVGWVLPKVATVLAGLGCRQSDAGIVLDDPAALPDLARAACLALGFAWRGEAFDVRAGFDGPVLATIDRGALPEFGIAAQGAHVNGLVRRAGGLCLWVARRAADRPLEPGKLDHLAAGGIAAGGTPTGTAIRELGEEAGVPPGMAAGLRAVGVIDYAAERPEGLRRDRLHCFDLEMPADFVPVAADGEVAGFALWPLDRVRRVLVESEEFKFNVALVLIDLLNRVRSSAEH